MRGLHLERLELRVLLHGGTISTPHDTVPLFGEDGAVMASGLWDAVGGDVRIPAGVTVTVNDLTATARNVLVEGTLRFDPSVDTRLLAETILVMPTGRLAILPNAGVNSEIVIADAPLDLLNDPEQFGHGVLVFGTVDIEGADKSDFIRLASEVRAGDTTLRLSEPAIGWKAGDTLVLPDTRQLTGDDGISVRGDFAGRRFFNNASPQNERLVIASVSADGLTVTLTTAVEHDHLGARDGDGVLRYLPHAANLTRSVVIRSENPEGIRGHFFATDDAQVEIENAGFVEMGRTTVEFVGPDNHVGRYAIHLHHLDNTAPFLANGERFLLSGNAVDGAPKWGIALHDTHYGRVADNVVYNAVGAGIVQEDGSETGNEFLYNFVLRSNGSGDTIDGRKGPNEANDRGHDGSNYWLGGWNQTVFVGNVASGAQFDGIVIFAKGVSDHVPVAPGSAEVMDKKTSIGDLPPAEFRDNEVYGATQNALDLWYTTTLPTPIENFVAWNVSGNGIMQVYARGSVELNSYTFLNDSAKRIRDRYTSIGLTTQSDFLATDLEVSGADIGIYHNPSLLAEKGIPATSFSRYEHLELANDVDFVIEGGTKDLRPQRTEILDAVFAGNLGLKMSFDPFDPHKTGKRLFTSEEVYVQFRGDENEYRAWHDAQRANFVVPQVKYAANGTVKVDGAPRPGMTNNEVLAEIGKAVGGEILDENAYQIDGHQAWFSLAESASSPLEDGEPILDPSAAKLAVVTNFE